jgi:8-oxo-dGTP pyrophosphatase MutT (NUDIX family)
LSLTVEDMVEDRGMERTAGRVIVVHNHSVLMMQGGDPARPGAGEWLFTIGGGCEPGESTAEAARREAREEAGLQLPDDLGPVVLKRRFSFEFNGTFITQEEDYYYFNAPSMEVDTSGWTTEETQVVSSLRWWTFNELRDTMLPVYPEALIQLLDSRGER